MTLYGYVLCIPVYRHASHHTYSSDAKHDGDRLLSLSVVQKKSAFKLSYIAQCHRTNKVKETWIIWIMRKRWFTCFTVLCSTTHSLMRMISYVGHDVDRFESMVWNRIESWRRNHLWNTALVPDASHFAHDFMCTTWCSLFFDCIFHGCRPLISLQKILHKWVCRHYSLHYALLVCIFGRCRRCRRNGAR